MAEIKAENAITGYITLCSSVSANVRWQTAPLSDNSKEYPTSVYISSYINGFYLLKLFLEPTMEINVVIIFII